MSIAMDTKPEDPDLITVLDFANQYRVDPAIVRSWIKKGLIPYILVGPRKMQCIRKSHVLKPLETTPVMDTAAVEAKVKFSREQLINQLMVHNEMSKTAAKKAVANLDAQQVEEMLVEFAKGDGDEQN